MDWCLIAAVMLAAGLAQYFVNRHWPRRITSKRIEQELRREFPIGWFEFSDMANAVRNSGEIFEFEVMSLPSHIKEYHACKHQVIRVVLVNDEWREIQPGRDYGESRYRIIRPKQVA